MIPLFSHTAIITIGTGHLEHGEWIDGESEEIEVKGRYFPSNNGNQVKKNENGDEFVVKGEFSTKALKKKGATRIVIKSKDLDAKIQSWEQFQSHSVIYI